MAEEYIYLLMTDKATGFAAPILKFILFLASLLYALGINIIFALRKNGILSAAHLGGKVISVGNLTLGGTGKTPLVELAARCLIERGKKVAILTRGYKIPSKEKNAAPNIKPLLFEEIGDEPALLGIKLPQATILVGPDRIKNGRVAISRYGADVLLLDDGFQHWRLSRDMDIVLIDALNPFGNGRLLPRGILREPASGLIRAAVVVITKVNAVTAQQIETLKSAIKRLNPEALIVTSFHKPVNLVEFANSERLPEPSAATPEFPPDWARGKEFVSVCAVADPDYFLKTLNSLGAIIKASLNFRDHHPYSFKDLRLICEKCRQSGADKIITTEKDMIKLKPLIERNRLPLTNLKLEFLALGIRLELIENQDKFIERLMSK